MKNFSVKFTRTFHSIGQGAFYTEVHQSKGEKFTVVYDCGSKTLKKNDLKRKINSSFIKGEKIDVLFISHFHADHINGLEYLKSHCEIKKVIIPLLADEDKIFLKIDNYLNYSLADTQLIEDPSAFFGDGTSVITIEDTSADNILDGAINDNIRFNLEKSGIEKKTASGSFFFSNKLLNEWYYIPFNYKQKERSKQFVKALIKRKLDIKNIQNIEEIEANKSEIKEAYNEIDGSLNTNSLIVFSGKKKGEIIKTGRQSSPCPICNGYHYLRTKSGCLYLGDINLNRKQAVKEIVDNLDYYYDEIGTIQIPHHGSIKNYNNELISDNIRIGILSFGENNHYGHPSDKIISDFISDEKVVFSVTENQKSMVVQWFVTDKN